MKKILLLVIFIVNLNNAQNELSLYPVTMADMLDNIQPANKTVKIRTPVINQVYINLMKNYSLVLLLN